MMHQMKYHMQHASWHHHEGQFGHGGQPGPHAENEFQDDGAPPHVEEGM